MQERREHTALLQCYGVRYEKPVRGRLLLCYLANLNELR